MRPIAAHNANTGAMQRIQVNMAGKKRPAAQPPSQDVQKRRSGRLQVETASIKTEDGGEAVIGIKREINMEEIATPDKTIVKTEASVELKCTATAPSPFAQSARPTPEECIAARDALATLHGEPNREKEIPDCTLLEKRSQTVLDSLVRTILSQNTTDTLSKRAFDSLKASFPTYRSVLSAAPGAVEESIKIGGLAATKVARIRAILETLRQERPHDCLDGEPSLEYLRSMGTEAIKKELGRFKGVGPKTLSCVLMFTLLRPEFPVDTHVWHIAKRLGWVPCGASREDTYLHLNQRVPDAIKYDLHVLLVRHGKVCLSCAKGGRTVHAAIKDPCPLTAGKGRGKGLGKGVKDEE